MRSHVLAFLAITLFVVSLGVLLFELTLTRIFSIVLWYDYAFMAISVAFFGLGIGSFFVHVQKNKIKGSDKEGGKEEQQPLLIRKIIQSAIAFAISLPIFVVVVGHLPSDTAYIYIYYLASSIPFFFAGVSIAWIFFAMPKQINKLYLVDLAGAASATLLLDPLMQKLGAESVLVFISIVVVGPSVLAFFVLVRNNIQDVKITSPSSSQEAVTRRIKVSSIYLTIGCATLLILNAIFPSILAIPPGVTKGLHQQLANQSVDHLFTWWNSFSRIDVTRPNYNTDNISGKPVEAATIIIDADAVTPVLRWRGSLSDIQWVKNYMDYLPYRIQNNNTNNTLVIGGGGGEDVLVGLAAGAKNVTAVELNPLVVSSARQFGSLSGNLYDRNDVSLFVDDGRRFISSTDAKYDVITIKLVDSWAAQLAGAYALTENYLYTVEAFKQYFAHLNDNNGMLVMVRWNTELPRLIPLVVESIKQQSGKSDEEIGKQMIVVEDRPGLYFGSDAAHTLYPVLVMVKNTPFTGLQVDLVKKTAQENGAEIIMLPNFYIKPPFDRLLPGAKSGQNLEGSSSSSKDGNNPAAISSNNSLSKTTTAVLSIMKPPTDDSPFYFAKEPVPRQMITLLITVLGISGVLGSLLAIYSKRNPTKKGPASRFYLVFAVFIGLGFMFLEITFIQKFLLLLGTPIMALTVILFSILLSSGIGAYLSGRIFSNKPHKAVFFSIPILVGIILLYYFFLGSILYSSVSPLLYERVALSFALLSPAGILMGFQFPSIVKMSNMHSTEERDTTDTTLLWGVNVIASVIGTVLAATFAMIIGFSGNLLVGFGLYVAALIAAILAFVITARQQKITA